MKTFNVIYIIFAAVNIVLMCEAVKSGMHPNIYAWIILLIVAYGLGFARITMSITSDDIKSSKD